MEFENLKLKCECGGKMEKIRTEWKGIEVRGWKCKFTSISLNSFNAVFVGSIGFPL